MKIKYNAPVTFTYIILAAFVLLVSKLVTGWDLIGPGDIVIKFFTIEGRTFETTNVLDYIRLFTHTFGHDSWIHLSTNIFYLVILGPILEEKYESKTFLGILIGTSVITGIFMALFQQPMVFGASTLVFMMIMLVSFVRLKPGEIPISLALIFVVVLLREMLALVGETGSGETEVFARAVNSIINFNGTSNLAHLLGGICGIIFGFMYISKKSGAPQPVEAV